MKIYTKTGDGGMSYLYDGSRIKKNDIVISIGGGIVQDISSFISSIIFRGVKWYYVPTTILGENDELNARIGKLWSYLKKN